MRVSFAAMAIAPCFTHAFVPHAVFPRSVARPVTTAMSSHEHKTEVGDQRRKQTSAISYIHQYQGARERCI